MSMFFSFATLYPDMQVLLYGIIPLKVKWLAWLDAALFAYEIVMNLLGGYFAYALLPLVAMLNYFVFFWDDILALFGRKKASVRHRTNPQTVNFKNRIAIGNYSVLIFYFLRNRIIKASVRLSISHNIIELFTVKYKAAYFIIFLTCNQSMAVSIYDANS